jgi:hypothetical protein
VVIPRGIRLIHQEIETGREREEEKEVEVEAGVGVGARVENVTIIAEIETLAETEIITGETIETRIKKITKEEETERTHTTRLMMKLQRAEVLC